MIFNLLLLAVCAEGTATDTLFKITYGAEDDFSTAQQGMTKTATEYTSVRGVYSLRDDFVIEYSDALAKYADVFPSKILHSLTCENDIDATYFLLCGSVCTEKLHAAQTEDIKNVNRIVMQQATHARERAAMLESDADVALIADNLYFYNDLPEDFGISTESRLLYMNRDTTFVTLLESYYAKKDYVLTVTDLALLDYPQVESEVLIESYNARQLFDANVSTELVRVTDYFNKFERPLVAEEEMEDVALEEGEYDLVVEELLEQIQ